MSPQTPLTTAWAPSNDPPDAANTATMPRASAYRAKRPALDVRATRRRFWCSRSAWSTGANRRKRPRSPVRLPSHGRAQNALAASATASATTLGIAASGAGMIMKSTSGRASFVSAWTIARTRYARPATWNLISRARRASQKRTTASAAQT